MQIVEVRLKFDDRLYTLFNDKLKINKNDYVICQSAVGESFGKVESVNDYDGTVDEDAKFVVRIADEKDKAHYDEVIAKSREAVKTTEEIVKRLGLEMSIVNAEYSFDLSKVVIDFIAEDRVDFRDLIKELVSTLKTRIELKQIGIREQAKIVGGIGICGRPCCCSSYLKEFEKVSIKMAKVQGLALNPQKISGACGRLMCCLSYENDFYTEVSKNMPKVNSEVTTKDGKGIVVYQNMLKETVSVKFIDKDGSTTIKDYSLKDLKQNLVSQKSAKQEKVEELSKTKEQVQIKDTNQKNIENKVEKKNKQKHFKHNKKQKDNNLNNQNKKNKIKNV